MGVHVIQACCPQAVVPRNMESQQKRTKDLQVSVTELEALDTGAVLCTELPPIPVAQCLLSLYRRSRDPEPPTPSCLVAAQLYTNTTIDLQLHIYLEVHM